jgi:hypothetical protein
VVRVWDARTAAAVAAMPLHNHGEHGAGAVAALACVRGGGGRIVSAAVRACRSACA